MSELEDLRAEVRRLTSLVADGGALRERIEGFARELEGGSFGGSRLAKKLRAALASPTPAAPAGDALEPFRALWRQWCRDANRLPETDLGFRSAWAASHLGTAIREAEAKTPLAGQATAKAYAHLERVSRDHVARWFSTGGSAGRTHEIREALDLLTAAKKDEGA